MGAWIVGGLLCLVVGVLFRQSLAYERGLIRIAHYSGDSVEELRKIAYAAYKWPRKIDPDDI
jgi:hypothetical protein